LSENDIGVGNVADFLDTHGVPELGNASSDLPFNFQSSQPYSYGNVLPFVQTTNSYNAYIHIVNDHGIRETHALDISATSSEPSTSIQLVDSFPKYHDNGDISNIGALTMGNLDGNIMFTTNIATGFDGNTTYYASVYESNNIEPGLALLHHLYNHPMVSGNLTGTSETLLQIEHYYANTDTTDSYLLQKDSTYKMALLLLETETNHYSDEIHEVELPTFYPNIDLGSFAAAPIPNAS
jgi:hypothetical protein